MYFRTNLSEWLTDNPMLQEFISYLQDTHDWQLQPGHIASRKIQPQNTGNDQRVWK